MPAKKAPVGAKPTKTASAPKTAIEALITAQNCCHQLYKSKSAHKHKYADLKDVFDACQSAFRVNNFAIYHISGQDDYGPYVDTVLHHITGEKFETRIYLVIGKNDMQAVGSAITYSRRYGLLQLAALAPEDDDGEATKGSDMPYGSNPNTSTQPPKPRAFSVRSNF